MSATVLTKPPKVDVDYMENAPQVHLHFYTSEEENKELGYGKVEICCHGCGKALLVYYTDQPNLATKYIEVRDRFVDAHRHCKNMNFEQWCPNFRTELRVKDLRTKPRNSRQQRMKGQQSKRGKHQTHSASGDKGVAEKVVARPCL